MADCFVRLEDYIREWQNGQLYPPLGKHERERLERDALQITPPIEVAPRTVERRSGWADRRRIGPDRRWETCRGRRFRLADRRKPQ